MSDLIGKTVWLSKYALSDGIRQLKVLKQYGKFVETTGYINRFLMDEDVHESEDIAKERAEHLRLKTIDQLAARLRRLENMKF